LSAVIEIQTVKAEFSSVDVTTVVPEEHWRRHPYNDPAPDLAPDARSGPKRSE
jgi:hypothetical protein